MYDTSCIYTGPEGRENLGLPAFDARVTRILVRRLCTWIASKPDQKSTREDLVLFPLSRMAGMLSLDWLFELVGACGGSGRDGQHDQECDEDSGFAGFSHMKRRHSLGSESVMSACSSASAVREDRSSVSARREDHYRDSRKDLKNHVLVMEGLQDQLRELGQVRAPSHKLADRSAHPPSLTENSIAPVLLVHMRSKTSLAQTRDLVNLVVLVVNSATLCSQNPGSCRVRVL